MPREISYCANCGSSKLENLNDEYVRCYDCKTHQHKLDLHGETLYTQAELNKAVQDEREAIIELGTDIIRKHFIGITSDQVEILTRYAEAIRARNK